MLVHRVLLALTIATTSFGAAALPIDKFITVQPIAVCDDFGSNCANADGILTSTTAVTNAVWAQAGIAVSFLPTRRFNESDYLVTDINPGNAATDEGRRLLRTPGQQQSDNPTTLNMYFVPQLRDASKGFANLNGFGFINGNGIIIGGAPRLDTLAHEIGHNLGLDHTTLGAGGEKNLMTDGTARAFLGSIADVAPKGDGLAQLSSDQITKARQPLFSVNQFTMQVQELAEGPGFRSYYGYSPTAYPGADQSFLRPGSPGVPPAGERLTAVRLRFLPGSDVVASLTVGLGWLDALNDANAEFNSSGYLTRSPGVFTQYNVDPVAPGPTIDCALGPNCAINKLALSERRILPDGTVELFWPLVGDSFGEANAFQRGYSGRTYLPAAQRTLPPFTFWDDMIIDVAPAINPLVGPERAPAPFSILFEFASRVTSQGFFDANGIASTLAETTLVTFSGEPSYGFVSDLRPAVDPEIAVSPADVSAPPAATVLLMALAGLSVTSSRRTRRA